MSWLADVFRQVIVDGLKSESITTCSAWANMRRVMTGDFAGPYSWKYHPWVKEMHDSESPFNYAMKAAQMGITEVVINRAFYCIDELKKDVLYVLPTAQDASDFSKARFTTALNNSPYLATLFTDTNTVNLKQAGSCNLYIRGSGGKASLVSIPVSQLILDEVDRMNQEQIWLAFERLSGHLEKHVWGLSTPTVPKYGIHKLFLTSTQDHFYFECPHCSRRTELIWPDCVEICGESESDAACHRSYLKCKECQHKLDHEAKPEWLANAVWKPTNLDANPDVRGFYINQLYSFTITPGELVVAHFRGQQDEAASCEFHNSKLGLPFVAEGAKVTDDMIQECIKGHSIEDPRPVYGGDRLITLGIDQGKVCYWVVCEWTRDKRANDINVAHECRVLAFGKFMEDEWWRAEELMVEWQVLACVVDADPQINEARRFAKKFHGYVYLCRYRKGQTAKEMSISEQDTGAPIATVDRTNWLTATLGRFRRKRILLPVETTDEYREHMQNLIRTYEKDETGNLKATFVSTGPDHFAHAQNYAEIGLPLAAAISSGQDIGHVL